MKKAKILSLLLTLIMLLSSFGLSVSAESTDARTQLENAIDEIEIQIPVGGNYSNESYSALIDSIEEARAMVEDENATDEEMLQQIDKMNAALDGLVAYNWDTDELWATIEKCEGMNREDFTEESYDHYAEAGHQARLALYYGQSQEEVDMASAEFKKATSKLVPVEGATVPAVVTELAYERFTALMEEAEYRLGEVGSNFIDSTYERLLNAYEAGLEVMDKEGVTNVQYTALSDELEAAIDGLAYPDLDKEAFWAVIESCEAINKEDYTKESYDNFNWVYTEVIAVFYYGDTQEELDEAQAKLEAAIDALVPIGATLSTDSTSASAPTESTTTTSETETVATEPSSGVTEPSTVVEPTETTTNEVTTNEATTNTVTTTTTETTILYSYYTVGDADGNLKVNIKDATAIQKHIAKMLELSENGQLAGDVNADNKLNIKDATEIQKYLANLPCSENIGKEVKTTPTEPTTAPSEAETSANTTASDATESAATMDETYTTAVATKATDPTESTADETVATDATEATDATKATDATETTTATEATTVASTETTTETEASDTVTVYFTNTRNWGTVNIHYWNNSYSTAWPGFSMDFVETNSDGDDVYKYSVPADMTGIIFNAGENSEQTIDILYFEDNMGFYPAKQGDMHWEVGTYEYIYTGGNTSVESKTIDFQVIMESRIYDGYYSEESQFYLVKDSSDIQENSLMEGYLKDIDVDALASDGKALVVLFSFVGSGSNTQQIEQINVTGNEMIVFRVITATNFGTPDMNYQMVVIEVNLTDVENVTQFTDYPVTINEDN